MSTQMLHFILNVGTLRYLWTLIGYTVDDKWTPAVERRHCVIAVSDMARNGDMAERESGISGRSVCCCLFVWFQVVTVTSDSDSHSSDSQKQPTAISHVCFFAGGVVARSSFL